MAIQLFDTLAGRKRDFTPLQAGSVRFYACGPTVYDDAHVGHARSYVVWDVVLRHLRSRGLAVRYVRNYTDVDDRIIQRAARATGSSPRSLARLMILSSTSVKLRTYFTRRPRALRWRTTTSQTT